jgi:hypothetical protein
MTVEQQAPDLRALDAQMESGSRRVYDRVGYIWDPRGEFESVEGLGRHLVDGVWYRHIVTVTEMHSWLPDYDEPVDRMPGTWASE